MKSVLIIVLSSPGVGPAMHLQRSGEDQCERPTGERNWTKLDAGIRLLLPGLNPVLTSPVETRERVSAITLMVRLGVQGCQRVAARCDATLRVYPGQELADRLGADMCTRRGKTSKACCAPGNSAYGTGDFETLRISVAKRGLPRQV